MIVRILGEGQWQVPDEDLDDLNRLDSDVESAVEKEDEGSFGAALTALLEAVRTRGTPLADDALEHSELILPHSDASLAEVRDLLNDDGLIPG